MFSTEKYNRRNGTDYYNNRGGKLGKLQAMYHHQLLTVIIAEEADDEEHDRRQSVGIMTIAYQNRLIVKSRRPYSANAKLKRTELLRLFKTGTESEKTRKYMFRDTIDVCFDIEWTTGIDSAREMASFIHFITFTWHQSNAF